MKNTYLHLIITVLIIMPIALFSAQTPFPGGGSAPAEGGETGGGSAPAGGETEFPNPFGNGITTLPEFIETLTNNVILPVGSVIVVIMIIYAGFLFVTAQGNENKITDAKRAFMYAVIGALILLGSWVIANSIRGTICLLYDDPPAGLECGN